jgi:predicted transcriptional regulator
MNLAKEKIKLAQKLLSTESEALIHVVKKIVEQDDWEGVTDGEIQNITEGLRQIETGAFVSHRIAIESINELFLKNSKNE